MVRDNFFIRDANVDFVAIDGSEAALPATTMAALRFSAPSERD